MHVGTAVTAAAMSLTMALGGGGAAWASPAEPGGRPGVAARTSLPEGWTLTPTASGFELGWRSGQPVRTGDAAVEFYAGDRLLGRPGAAGDQRTFRLLIDDVTARNLTDLRVRASGRRLDAPVEETVPRGSAAPPALAAAQLPANPVDPGLPGPYSTTSGEYALPDVQLPGFAVPVEMRGYVVAPQGTSGQRPLLLILHGRHPTCYQGTAEPTTVWPCPSGWNTLPSHRGYERIQQLLASQGYVTVSVAANSINAQDGAGLPPQDAGAQARSSLVRLHLGRWADWAGSGRSTAPDVVRSAPVPNMSNVLLVGHSRGGEGVSRAAVDSLSRPPAAQDGYPGTVRWQIRGLALIAPSIYSHNPAPDVPSVTILPSCDGDLSDLEGQLYADATRGVGRGFALHGVVYAVGANHNYFNTEWTPGLSAAKSWDDYPSPYDPVCRSASPSRLTPVQQQNVGASYVAAAAATFVAGNDQVRPLLDGSGFRAPSTDPATVLSHAVGGNRTRFLVPDSSTVVNGAAARLCEQVAAGSNPAWCANSNSPHFATFDPIVPEAGRYAIEVDWRSPGTPVNLRPPAAVSLSSAEAVALRVAVPSGSPGTQFDIAVADSAGRQATLGTATLEPLPAPTQTADDWAQEVRMPLTNARSAGLNLNQVTTLVLVPRAGETWARIWLIDAWGWRSGTPAPQPVSMPRVDLGERTVQEGNSGTVTYQVPAQVSGSGSGTGQVRVFVVDPVTGLATASLVNVTSGSTTIAVPVPVTGNTQPGDGRRYVVAVKAVQGVSVGDAYGMLTVQDDD
ncbi:hypothetical protein O7626_13690 [Micromonospora sp. WMMD1102]|uniref:hypothetical protein n=1 Tax=Micromonospora sp. WMMD1102 TaxID=3016105 RepID=UPI0024158D5F|nr:hypothetical protein [Micromonospora sp. WMMD1102]MDG4786969.1 hypothetical protein [Micromonospora sp. WMMD1102]